MRLLTTLFLTLFLTVTLFGQEDRVKELISQGIELHDQGKYDDAIAKYKQALQIDKNSAQACFELAYSGMLAGYYSDAVESSTKVVKQKGGYHHEAYLVLGSCLDLMGEPEKAIKAYKKGLSEYPESNLLNYNIALTLYNQKEYDKAEAAAIKAIEMKPAHSSSHILLSAIMDSKGKRVQSLLSLYYALMLEPESKRSKINYASLRKQLGQGVEQKDAKTINVNISLPSKGSDEFGPAELMVSMLAATSLSEENKGKNEMELFAETTNSFFSVLGELKKNNKNLWWDLYVTKFYDLVQSGNCEAFSYYISQSQNSALVNEWIANNNDKMQQLTDWMNKQ